MMSMNKRLNASKSKNLTLLSLLWDDVLFPYVLSRLSLKDLFCLRGTSTDYKRLVNCYLTRMKKCDVEGYGLHFTQFAFLVLINNCKGLNFLSVRNTQCITNVLVKAIVVNNESITHIDLSGCTHMNSAALQPILLRLKKLLSLKLEHCLWLTPGSIEAVALHHTKLETISFENSSTVDMRCICFLLQRSHNLRHLNLSGILIVNDDVLQIIARYNKKLKSLAINRCVNVTNYGVTMVCEYCKELENLHIKGCSVTFQTVIDIRKKVAHVEFSELQGIVIDDVRNWGNNLYGHLQV